MSEPLTVLIIEDEALIAANLEMILEDAGHLAVGWATNAEEALSLAAASTPRFAIVDIQLRNGDDGITVAAEIQERFGTQIVFVTAQTDPRTIARAKAIRHRAYVAKPYNGSTILKALVDD
jgi:DNA-binding NarL/FixJ family response regulator